MPNYRVVLVEPAFDESIGFVARAMKNFGLKALHVVRPAKILGKEGRMRGGHAQETLDSIVFHDRLSDALNGLDLVVGTSAQKAHSEANLLRKPSTPRELGKVLSSPKGTVGIVIGREGTGLSNRELSLCDMLVTIPASEEYPTLNISHAAAIIFYELFNAAPVLVEGELATERVRETILSYLSESLSFAGLPDYKIGLTIRAMKNVMGRSAIRRREGSLLAGALRLIADSIEQRPGGEVCLRGRAR